MVVVVVVVDVVVVVVRKCFMVYVLGEVLIIYVVFVVLV